MILFKKYFCSITHGKRTLYLQNIIKPMYIVVSLLGLLPYSVTFVKSKHSYTIMRKSIYFNSLCAVVVFLHIFILTCLHIRELWLANENVNLTETIMTQMNYVLELALLVFFCAVAYICAFLNRAKYVRILNQLLLTWRELPPNDNNQNVLSYLQFQVNVVCMSTLFIVLILQICVNFTRDNSLWKIILVTFTFNLPQMVQFVSLSFYYMLVVMIIGLLMSIEWHCRRLLDDNANFPNGFVIVQNRLTLSLRQMKLIYIRAFEMKCDINEAFQGPILATTLQCFHCMVSESHIIYHGLVIQNSLTTHEIVNCSVWILYQILKIYSIAYSGNLLKLQASKIGQILHSIPTAKRDSKWFMEIQHFSTLMNSQEIELNVYGYFPLNATLVYNMMASVAMYLIVLVQFDKRE